MIGIISRTEGEGGGAEMILCHLLSNWNKNCPLVIITAKRSSVANAAKLNGIQVIELSFVPSRIWPNLRTVEKSLNSLKHLKVIHAWNAKSFELGWYISRRLGIKLTCTIHDHPLSNYFSKSKLWLLRKIANVSSGVVAVSNILGEECKANGYPTDLNIIQNGIPEIEIAGENKGEQQKVRIGFLGMGSEIKGFPIIADWIQKTSNHSHIQWNLFGDVCDSNKSIVDKLDKAGGAHFKILGRQEPELIFKHIDILIHSSTVFDCFPTVLLEAARSGVAAIASSNGGGPEIVEHGQTGFIFNPDMPDSGYQYLSQLLKDKLLCQRFSRNAKERFTQCFGISNMVDKYQQFWLERIESNQSLN